MCSKLKTTPIVIIVLEKNFPNVNRYLDINEFDAAPYRGSIDVLSGGFPCQPFSLAGKQKGNEDPRALWPQMLRVIKEVQPRFVVGENVPGILSLENGQPFEQICTSLESEGYKVEPYVLPACAVGALHIRQRVFIVAYSHGLGCYQEQCEERKLTRNEIGNSSIEKQEGRIKQRGIIESSSIHSNTQGQRAGRLQNKSGTQKPQPSINVSRKLGRILPDSPSERHQGRETGYEDAKDVRQLPSSEEFGQWHTEPKLGRVANGIPNRVERIRGLGNAVVPQLAFEIFKPINQLLINSNETKNERH